MLKKIVIGMGLIGALSSVFACECQSVDKVIQKELSIKGAASTISVLSNEKSKSFEKDQGLEVGKTMASLKLLGGK